MILYNFLKLPQKCLSTVGLYASGFKVYTLHLVYIFVKSFKICKSFPSFLFPHSIICRRVWIIFPKDCEYSGFLLFIFSWFYLLTCYAIPRILCKMMVRSRSLINFKFNFFGKLLF